jgi:hypothetical protein
MSGKIFYGYVALLIYEMKFISKLTTFMILRFLDISRWIRTLYAAAKERFGEVRDYRSALFFRQKVEFSQKCLGISMLEIRAGKRICLMSRRLGVVFFEGNWNRFQRGPAM